jgi:hypothetical protein
MPLEAVDILPGAVPGAAPALTSGALAAPFGAGEGVLLVPLLAVPDIADIVLPEDAGAMFPGVPDGVTRGAVTAPVGAGAGVCVLCAQAMPVVINRAVDANHNVRIVDSWMDEGCSH